MRENKKWKKNKREGNAEFWIVKEKKRQYINKTGLVCMFLCVFFDRHHREAVCVFFFLPRLNEREQE